MVRLESTIRRYIGLSSDVKPAPGVMLDGIMTDMLPPGSSFLESDTGRIYRWTGSEWSAAAHDDSIEQMLGALLESVNSLPERLAEVLCNV